MAALSYQGVHYTVYTAVGYFIAFIFSYVLNGAFTFRAERLSIQNFLLFSAISASLLVLVEILLIVLIEYLGLRELVAVVLGMCTYTGIGFIANRRIVYKAA